MIELSVPEESKKTKIKFHVCIFTPNENIYVTCVFVGYKDNMFINFKSFQTKEATLKYPKEKEPAPCVWAGGRLIDNE